MEMSEWLFVFFGAMIVVPVLFLLFSKDVVRSAFAFVVSLLGLAAVYVLLNAEVIAVVQILIYAGGVIVLLIFGIMLTKRTSTEGVTTGHRNVWVALLVALLTFGLLVKWIVTSSLVFPQSISSEVNQVNHVGVSFLTDNIIAFEVVAVLLLIALIGSAFLAKKSSEQ